MADHTGGGFPRFDLDGRTALVTGAARGIGRTLALALADAGADVALGLRDVGDAADLEQAIATMGRRSMRVAMDVRDLSQINDAVDRRGRRLGRLDILVNNAGLGPANDAVDVTEADYDLTFDVNVKGTFFASQAAGRAMIRQGFGRIINLSSQAGFVALPTESVYCTTKAAIAHLTKCLAVEWGGFGITVNAVAPTFIRTPGTEPRPRRPRLPRRGRRADCRPAPHRRTGRRRRSRRVPRLAGRRPDHRHDPADRRWLDRPIGPTCRPSSALRPRRPGPTRPPSRLPASPNSCASCTCRSGAAARRGGGSASRGSSSP